MGRYLIDRGAELVAANWHCRFGELDLIARWGDYLCFVEVKLRKSDRFAPARAFVTPAKQKKLRITAELYLAGHPTTLQPRFDVAEVYAPLGADTVRPKIQYWENIF